MTYIANANEVIKASDKFSTVDKGYARTVAVEMEERLQEQIEQHALPLLKELRQRRSGFLNTDMTAMGFFHFIAHQYFRTKRIREAIGKELSQIETNYDFARLTNIVCHIGAVNVGGSLYVDRNEFEIIFLDDTDEAGFITGDQPLVNLMGARDGRETTELALYYPLGPDLSCIVVPKECTFRSAGIPRAVVEELNDLIAWESRNFLVAKSVGALERIVSKQSSTRPSTRGILDSLVKTG